MIFKVTKPPWHYTIFWGLTHYPFSILLFSRSHLFRLGAVFSTITYSFSQLFFFLLFFAAPRFLLFSFFYLSSYSFYIIHPYGSHPQLNTIVCPQATKTQPRGYKVHSAVNHPYYLKTSSPSPRSINLKTTTLHIV